MHTLLDRQCRGCGWPATNGHDTCEGCAHAPWEFNHVDDDRESKGYG